MSFNITYVELRPIQWSAFNPKSHTAQAQRSTYQGCYDTSKVAKQTCFHQVT